MRTEEQIAEFGRRINALKARYGQTTEDDIDTVTALEKEPEALLEEIGEDEERVIEWIDEQQWLVDMTLCAQGVFDADGYYVPLSRR